MCRLTQYSRVTIQQDDTEQQGYTVHSTQYTVHKVDKEQHIYKEVQSTTVQKGDTVQQVDTEQHSDTVYQGETPQEVDWVHQSNIFTKCSTLMQ